MRIQAILAATLLAVGAPLLPSCGGDSGGGSSNGTPDTGADVADSASDGQDDAVRDDVEGDGTTTDLSPIDSAVRAGVGEPCQANEECASALCLRLPGVDEGFCTSYCFDSTDCPESDGETGAWSCVFLRNSGGDAANVCVPDDLCFDSDADEYGVGPGCRGPDCDDDRAASNPGADELCDGIDNDCDGNIDENPIDANVDCDTGFLGQCAAGRAWCQGGFIVCEPSRTPADELCDLLDNDCDGETDEGDDGLPLSEACYSGPVGTEGIGACVGGHRTCRAGRVSDCEGQTLPFAEVCDAADNDCDGETDEGGPGEGVACDTGLDGVCSSGLTSCDGGAISCIARREAVEETCDGLDNDCDGETDEGDDGGPLERTCYEGPDGTLGMGWCAEGVETCDGGEWGLCIGDVLPEPELCDRLDNDCNGEIDEGDPAGGFLCSTGLLGVCARGQTECGSGSTECVPLLAPSDETCDGLDNDCDGQVDADPIGDPLARSCYTGPAGTEGVGACAGGAQTCAIGEWATCSGQILPSMETCDGIDNDCDGTPDDGNPGGGFLCNTGSAGLCAPGTTACVAGVVECVPDVVATDEICDGLDNDCDGQTDEGALWLDLSQGCVAGLGACVAAGVRICDPANPGGPTVCSATPGAAGTETCDGIDNDCDGSTDEGALWADRGNGCTAGAGVCQAAGVRICDPADPAGPTVCSGVAGAPQTEICDGLDNDCNGQTDESATWGSLGEVCMAGMGVCQRAGVNICNSADPAGAPICSATPGSSSTEVCDGLDNDCDGQTDEGAAWVPKGTVCTVGLGMCQAAGVYVCDVANPAGPLVCSETAGAPSAEVCDGLDNDCDGSTDEDALWSNKGTVCTGGAGECRRSGTYICNAASPSGPTVCSAAPGTPATEICDGLDNDCDGTNDDGFTGLGTACTAGQGVCRRSGVYICDTGDRSAPPVCDTLPGTPSATEACDYLDDDCDGQVDEDFRSGTVYSSVTNCGGCGVDCNALWLPSPSSFHVVPTCDVVGSTASCDFACEAGWFNVDLDPANGCEFQPDPGAVYVHATTGADTATCGDPSSTCRSITQGLARALALGRVRVRVADGLYRENVTLANGISVLGGHNSTNWSRNASVYVSNITGLATGIHNAAVTATNITASTEFSGFTVNGPNGVSGGNSYGIYVSGSNQNLTIRDNTIYAGTGGPGSRGVDGANGANGVGGGNGNANATRNDCSGSDIAGGASGALVCNNPAGGTTTVSGGAGGGSACPNPNLSCNIVCNCNWSSTPQAGSGGTGQGGAGGTGGAGGYHMIGSGSSCFVPPNETIFPTSGLPGNVGSDGAGGSGATDTDGSVDGTGNWVGATGGNANHGASGSGGGGGGAAAGIDGEEGTRGGCLTAGDGNRWYAATGGGGGSGGCAGARGNGGSGGGGSFAIFIYFPGAGPASSGAMPVLTNNRLTRGNGGNGGEGGTGGAGGGGGLGGLGGTANQTGTYGFCMNNGGNGAQGGRGGHGGGGGGGAGGASFDLYVWNNNGNDPGYAAGNTFTLAAGTNTGGTGGRGGNSSNTANVGATGAAGAYGQTLFVP